MSNSQLAGKVIKAGSFTTRLFGYAFFYIPILLVFTWIMIMNKFGFGNIFDIVYYLIIAIPFVLWERAIRTYRRENNLSIYKNIEKELEQLKFDEIAEKEHKAKKNLGIASENNKDNLEYWHNLLKEGAITPEEYDFKKKELL